MSGTGAGGGGGPDLVVDTQLLRDAGSTLRQVVTDFEAAPDLVDQVAPHLGHRRLANALDSFATNWSTKREQIVGDVQGLATVAEEAGKTYEEIETQLVAALVSEQ